MGGGVRRVRARMGGCDWPVGKRTRARDFERLDHPRQLREMGRCGKRRKAMG